MTDPQHLADHAWKDAQALVERIEQAARSNVPVAKFFNDLTSGLRLTTGASTVAIGVTDRQKQSILARSGISIHDDQIVDFDDHSVDHAPRSEWISDESQDLGRLVAAQRIHRDVQLNIDLRFDRPVEFALRQPLNELVEVVMELAATVYTRCQLNELRVELAHRTNRDALISQLNEGLALSDSFSSIASAIASQTLVDRVSLLRFKSPRYRLITTSTQPVIDRRARQSRLLERLAATTLENADRFTFTVGAPSEVNQDTIESLDGYLHESGCREIHIEPIRDKQKHHAIAAIVLERFRTASADGPSIDSLLDPIREPVSQAVRSAIRRDDAPWGLIASRLAAATNRRRASFAAAGLLMLILASCWVPATLKIPVEGRVIATRQSRLYAPAEGIVVDVVVNNGQHVRKAQTLVILRSPNLDLQQRNMQGALSTARTRLDSLIANRSRSGGLASRERESNGSADEQVLKTEIEGLEKQLQLVRAQQDRLTIVSPIDGKVDRWDLQRSLIARPVTHGQYLLDVNSIADGWTVELDLPEENVNYVLDQQRLHPCRCTFRLRSNPTKTHDGMIQEIAEVAHLNPQGKSVIRVTLPIQSDATDNFRTGASVTAQIDCGQRPIGFVWLRGLIQWSRSQTWF